MPEEYWQQYLKKTRRGFPPKQKANSPKPKKRKKRKERLTPEERRRRVYRERNLVLKAMGFASYKVYIASELWKSIRGRVLLENPSCFSCGKPAAQVHHRFYTKDVLEGRNLRGLFSVCGSCHYKSEFRRSDKEKLNPAQATARLRQMATWRQKAENEVIEADLATLAEMPEF